MRCIELVGQGKLVRPKPEACEAYNEKLQERLQKTVWAGNGDSWYQVNGRITALYPGDGSEYAAERAELLLDELDIAEITSAVATRETRPLLSATQSGAQQ